MTNKLYFILLGTLLGLFLIYIPGTLFIFFCIFIISILIKSFAKEEDKSFILSIFLIGMGMRILLAVILHFLCIYLHIGYDYFPDRMYDPLIVDRYALGVIGDSAFTSLRGWWLSQIWHGNIDRSWFLLQDMLYAPRDHHFRIYAVFYYLFGFSQLGGRLINSLFSMGTAILIYYIAKDIFDKRVAKLAAIFSAFFPTIVLWSVTDLKEPINSFLFCLTIFSIQRLISIKKIRYLFLLIISFANIFIRYQFGIFIIAIASLISLMSLLKNKFLRLPIILIICFMIVSPLGKEKIKLAETKLVLGINTLMGMQRGTSSSPGSAYKIYPEDLERISSIEQVFSPVSITSLARGFLFFVLAPFPWEISSKLQLLMYPQMILWYFLLLFVLPGIIYSLRYDFKKSLFVLFFLFSSVLLSSMASGNIGSAVRHRDIMTPLILLFSAAGLTLYFSPKAKVGSENKG
ncbi:MAG: glycosyltransferase family 39 protein [Candidatus Omnitrophica bacterium]|nr:glycosyltransferase family 39 protein [Candidatus Omnitrophota bacterium]